MRVICPSCAAEYEVPLEMIPQAGRDVECSNCAETWWVLPPDPTQLRDPSSEDPHPKPPEPATAPATGPSLPDDAAETRLDPAPDEAPQETPAPSPARVPSQIMAPEALAILKEEAARETAARHATADPLESQPELGPLPPSFRPNPQMPSPEAPSSETSPKPKPVAKPRGRDLLPDIEDYGPPTEPQKPPLQTTTEQPGADRGFSRGFIAALAIALLALLPYLFATDLAQGIPALEPTLAKYVSWVDGVRMGLEARASAALPQK